jgi:hypothetical protein
MSDLENEVEVHRRSFLGKNHKLVEDYFKSLLIEISAIRQQFIQLLNYCVKTGKWEFTINEKELDNKEAAKAFLNIIEDEPGRLFWNWEFLYDKSQAIEVFKSLERFLKDTPGGRMPNKDSSITDWMEGKIE